MDKARPPLRLAMVTAYLLLGLAIMALRLMPHNMGPGGWPGPDLLVCLTFAWVMRRPDHVPVLAIAAVFLTADLLFQRPPGLWTALALGASEILRARVHVTRPLSFPMEWALIGLLILAMVLSEWAVLVITMVPQPGLQYELWQAAVTVMVYPVMVWALRTAGIRKPSIAQGVIRGGRS